MAADNSNVVGFDEDDIKSVIVNIQDEAASFQKGLETFVSDLKDHIKAEGTASADGTIWWTGDRAKEFLEFLDQQKSALDSISVNYANYAENLTGQSNAWVTTDQGGGR